MQAQEEHHSEPGLFLRVLGRPLLYVAWGSTCWRGIDFDRPRQEVDYRGVALPVEPAVGPMSEYGRSPAKISRLSLRCDEAFSNYLFLQ